MALARRRATTAHRPACRTSWAWGRVLPSNSCSRRGASPFITRVEGNGASCSRMVARIPIFEPTFSRALAPESGKATRWSWTSVNIKNTVPPHSRHGPQRQDPDQASGSASHCARDLDKLLVEVMTVTDPEALAKPYTNVYAFYPLKGIRPDRVRFCAKNDCNKLDEEGNTTFHDSPGDAGRAGFFGSGAIRN